MVHHHSDKIDLSSANIADWTARTNAIHSEQQERKVNHEQFSKELANYQEQLKDENADWDSINAQFTANQRLIKQALKAMKDSKNRVDGSFLQVSGLTEVLTMADSLGLIEQPKQKAIASSLLQGAADSALLQGRSHSDATKQDPLDSYGYHEGSSDVIDLVQSLMTQMK